MKSFIRKIVPKTVLGWYHLLLAYLAAVWFRHPSEKLIVIGITGTSGKSSAAYFLRQILEYSGKRVGVLSTIEFCVAGDCKLNDKKMTMLGRTAIQKFLRRMVDTKCDVAIIETTSEGYLQHRHRFINYDTIVLTNLYPEHIEAHGGFENYKAAKFGIFHYVANCRKKTIQGKIIPKTAIVNSLSEYANEFLSPTFDKKVIFGAADALPTPILGEHTPQNVAAALVVARQLGIEEERLKAAAAQLQGAPGRIEIVYGAQPGGPRIIVDYAFEPVAMEALYKVVEKLSPKRVIHVLGSCGGGRDAAVRPAKGEFVATRADIVIVTNEDPYDDDPMKIIDDVAKGVEDCKMKNAKCRRVELFKILDRKEAIQKALSLAQEGDVVLVTGKGSEQAMVIKGGKKIPWDDREVIRGLLYGKKEYVAFNP